MTVWDSRDPWSLLKRPPLMSSCECQDETMVKLYEVKLTPKGEVTCHYGCDRCGNFWLEMVHSVPVPPVGVNEP